LAWLGGFRPEPFTLRDRQVFRALIPPIRARLKFERALEHIHLCGHSIDALIDEIPGAVFVVDGSVSRLRLANQAARAMLLEDRPRTCELIKSTVAGKPAIGWRSIRVQANGVPVHYLVIGTEPRSVNDRMFEFARTAWGLTPAETRVLQLVIRGEANKTIAANLERSISVVELHVSSLLRKAGVDCRAALVSRFWQIRE
jgi:DNA-binding CsgD family transcriptional regulator